MCIKKFSTFFYLHQSSRRVTQMKKYFSNLITILISCTLIACTVFFSVYDGFENRVMPIEEEITPKISADDTTTGVNMNLINTKDIFGSKINQNNGSNPASSASDPANSHSAPTYPTRKSVTSRKTTSATTASTEKAGTQTTKPVKVPEDESKNETYIKDPDYKSKYYIVVYTGSQSVVVYGKDESGAYNVIVKAFTVSTGKSSTPTRKGMYKIRAKYRWRMLMGPCWGQWCSSISSSYLFHSVPYDQKRPDTLYNASYNKLGRAASHGCIRMCVRDVKWIYDNCPIGTQVHVVWESGPKGAGVPKRKSGSKYSGWDPSDKWSEGNPYFKNVEETTLTTKSTTKSTTKTTEKSTETQSTTSSSVPTSSTKKTKTTTTAKTTSTTTSPSANSSQDPNEESSE